MRHLAAPIRKPGNLNDQVNGRGNLLANSPDRQIQAGHEDHVFDAREGVTRRVCVHCAERALVAGVHRLHHVERLRTAHLTNDDAVRPHAQGVAHQVALGHLALPLQARRAGL